MNAVYDQRLIPVHANEQLEVVGRQDNDFFATERQEKRQVDENL